MSPETEQLSTNHKALHINLDHARYGTFAEIGAGQEVVRWFFHVGGAAGTIAKSMSAYDMTVSDAIYGPCQRYVCRQRLEAMLDREYALNLDRLQESRGDTTAFFAFADTVSARNYQGTNECHGWMGVAFQMHPRDEVNQIILHVRMLDLGKRPSAGGPGDRRREPALRRLLPRHEPEQLMESLLDNLSTRRIEIDMIEFSGIGFRHVDNRVMSLRWCSWASATRPCSRPTAKCCSLPKCCTRSRSWWSAGSFRPVRTSISTCSAAPTRSSRASPSGRRADRDADGTHDEQAANGRQGDESTCAISSPGPTCWRPAATRC